MEIPKTRRVRMRIKFLALLITCVAGLAWALPATAQISIIPGSSIRGGELFQQRGCVQCHSFSGTPQAQTPMLLAAALWNHSPEMWRAQNARNVRPMLDSKETADLFAYFFSLAYFRSPGDASRGALVFEQKSCSRCHETVA